MTWRLSRLWLVASPWRRPLSTSALHKHIFPEPLQAQPIQQFKSFDRLSLHPSILSALTATDKKEPTPIQVSAIPTILSSRHTLIAAETGSGKTLAYLIPLLSALKTRETALSSASAKSAQWEQTAFLTPMSLRPSILILQPTRELADQAFRVAKALSHVAKVRVRAISGGSRRKALDRNLGSSPVDVLVATPGAVTRLTEQNKLFLSQVRAIVLDEADELLEAQHAFDEDEEPGQGARGEGDEEQAEKDDHVGASNSTQSKKKPRRISRHFAEQLQPILRAVSREDVQFVYAAATVPARLERWVQQRHSKEGLQVVRGDRLHMATSNSRIKTVFIRVDGSGGMDEAKFRKMTEIVTSAHARADSGKMLVFCDDVTRRDAVVDKLQAHGVRAVHLGGGGGGGRSDGGGGQSGAWKRDEDWAKFRDNEVRVAVCAKSFGRGIDDRGIRTVVLMDVPYTGAEYLHRVGRIRGSGRVYVLVGRREETIAESLFVSHVKGERVAGIDPKRAWQAHLDSSQDRIQQERKIRLARKNEVARWVDERASMTGTFRGRRGSSETETTTTHSSARPSWEQQEGLPPAAKSRSAAWHRARRRSR